MVYGIVSPTLYENQGVKRLSEAFPTPLRTEDPRRNPIGLLSTEDPARSTQTPGRTGDRFEGTRRSGEGDGEHTSSADLHAHGYIYKHIYVKIILNVHIYNAYILYFIYIYIIQ